MHPLDLRRPSLTSRGAATGRPCSCSLLACSPVPPSAARPSGRRGAHEGSSPAAASAAPRSSRSAPGRRGQGRGMSAEPELKAASEPEAGAMPEKRAGAQAASGSSVSAGAGCLGGSAQFEVSSQGRLGGVAVRIRSRLSAGSGLWRPGGREDADSARRLGGRGSGSWKGRLFPGEPAELITARLS